MEVKKGFNKFCLITHSIIFFIFFFDALYHIFLSKMPSKNTYAGEYKYLTIWCLFFQVFYFAIASLADMALYRHSIYQNKLWKLRDFVYTTIAFPLGAAVCVIFWTLFNINRELVYPKYLDDLIPAWHNHILHTAPIVFLTLDSYLCKFEFAPYRNRCSKLLYIIILYYIWLVWIKVVGKLWAYPIFDILNPIQIVLFLTSIMAFIMALVYVGEKINYILWKPKIPIKTS